MNAVPLEHRAYFFQSDEMGVLPLIDPDFDETVADLSDCEMVTLTQIDEQGRTHTVVLSLQMMLQLAPSLDQWRRQSLTQVTPPAMA
jgi:hypothetical protein